MKKAKVGRKRCRICPFHKVRKGVWQCAKADGKVIKSPPGPVPKGHPAWCPLDARQWAIAWIVGLTQRAFTTLVLDVEKNLECTEIRIGDHTLYKRKEEKQHDGNE